MTLPFLRILSGNAGRKHPAPARHRRDSSHIYRGHSILLRNRPRETSPEESCQDQDTSPRTGVGSIRTMAARIVHIGADTCHRLAVLKNAGYAVENCGTVVQLRAALESDPPPHAVLMTESDQVAPKEAVSLARAKTAAPLILFRDTLRSYADSEFDLVVPVLSSPETWLSEIAAIIARTQELQAQSAALQAESAALRRESVLVREKSRRERQRSELERSRNESGPKDATPPRDTTGH